jgi:hypothetical protein
MQPLMQSREYTQDLLVSPCRARLGLQAQAVTQVACVQAEIPATPFAEMKYLFKVIAQYP